VHNATDGEEFTLGNLTIRAIHTPGHTPESTCYLLLDENMQEYCVFSGDTLFVGDVGRPDLLDGKMTKEELAGMMYDSLNNKIKRLPDRSDCVPCSRSGLLLRQKPGQRNLEHHRSSEADELRPGGNEQA
jgi:glyoxylase-like metal-dependent hydrolase (beta-lactamase superfamily II)